MTDPVSTLNFWDTMIDIYPDSTLITFVDGSTVPGAPQDTDSYRDTAERYGYEADTLRLCQEHEVTHIALCHWLGIDSPTMTLLREGDDDRLHYFNRLEECAVLSIQHLARAAGVDLLARMKEWSQTTK
jgi:hypothetical protein